MRALTTIAVVSPDRKLTLTVPEDVIPGPRTVVVVLEDPAPNSQGLGPFQFFPHAVGPVDCTCTYRREDIYGDDGR